MPSTPNIPTGRAGLLRRGFSLIELIVVLIVTGILAAAAIPSVTGRSTTTSRAAARHLARDLSFCRARAMATGTTVWMRLVTSTSSYTVLAENPTSPGRAGATALTDPATGRSFSQALASGDYPGVTLTTVSIGGGTQDEVGFDWLGRPKDQAEALLTSAGTISMSGGITITIQPGTGLVSITP